MTDNEIIKALECHSRESNSCGNNCPYLICEEVMCTKKLSKDALDLINRQKKNIKELKYKVKKWKENYESSQVVVGDFREIINKQAKELKTAKAEANKEFVERLHEELRMYGTKDKFNKAVFLNVVDRAKKELVGEKNVD